MKHISVNILLLLKKLTLSVVFLSIILFLLNYSASSYEKRHFKLGIGYIPRNFTDATEADWLDMLTKVKDVGELLLLQTGWRDSVASSGQIPALINNFSGNVAVTFEYEPCIGINFFNLTDGEPTLNTNANATNDWTNEDAQQNYRTVALAICQTHNPVYLGLGIEVNTYYQYHPEDFERFVEFYKQLYSEIKQLYPSTKVFVSFQLEKMKGIGKRRFGVTLESQWELLSVFNDYIDLAVFTSYPGLEYDNAATMPETYYSEILLYTNKPVAFSELGWESDYDSFTEQHQVDFINRFVTLTEGVNYNFSIWAFMHDINGSGALNTIGLRKVNGDAKASWAEWKELKDTPYESAPVVPGQPTGVDLLRVYNNIIKPPEITHTTINYIIKEPGKTTLLIYDTKGNKIKTLIDKHLLAGSYSTTWDAQNAQGEKVGSGIYLILLKKDNHTHTKKVAVVR